MTTVETTKVDERTFATSLFKGANPDTAVQAQIVKIREGIPADPKTAARLADKLQKAYSEVVLSTDSTVQLLPATREQCDALFKELASLITVRTKKKGDATAQTKEVFVDAALQRVLLDARGKGYATLKDFAKNILAIKDAAERNKMMALYADALSSAKAQPKHAEFVARLIEKLKDKTPAKQLDAATNEKLKQLFTASASSSSAAATTAAAAK